MSYWLILFLVFGGLVFGVGMVIYSFAFFPNYSKEEIFDKVHIGMSYEEVEPALGIEAEWKSDKFMSFRNRFHMGNKALPANITVIFSDNKVSDFRLR